MTKKSGGVTISDLRFGKHPIRRHIGDKRFYRLPQPIVHQQIRYAETAQTGGVFCSTRNGPGRIGEKLPGAVKRFLAETRLNFTSLMRFRWR